MRRKNTIDYEYEYDYEYEFIQHPISSSLVAAEGRIGIMITMKRGRGDGIRVLLCIDILGSVCFCDPHYLLR